MRQFLFTGVALSSVVLTTALLEFSAKAQTLASSPGISVAQITTSEEQDCDIDVFTSGERNSWDIDVSSSEDQDCDIDVSSENRRDFWESKESTSEDQNYREFEESTSEDQGFWNSEESTSEDRNYRDSEESTSKDQFTSAQASLEQEVHDQVNQYRASRGLPPLSLDSRISKQARTHSQNMANGAVGFSHDGYNQRMQTLATMIPYSGASENVGYNQGYSDPGNQAVQGWLASTGHRENIEGDYNKTGIGVAKNPRGEYYFTQVFMRDRSSNIERSTDSRESTNWLTNSQESIRQTVPNQVEQRRQFINIDQLLDGLLDFLK